MQQFRFWCHDQLAVCYLEEKCFVDIVSSLERADVVSTSKLDFLARFLKAIKNEKLLEKLRETETEIMIALMAELYRSNSVEANDGFVDVVERTVKILKSFVRTDEKRILSDLDVNSIDVQELLDDYELKHDLRYEELAAIMAFYCEIVKKTSQTRSTSVVDDAVNKLRQFISKCIGLKLQGWVSHLITYQCLSFSCSY